MRMCILSVQSFIASAILLGISFGSWHQALAQNPLGRIQDRCNDDQLSSAQAVERNIWAHKCGYMDKEELDFYQAKEKFIVFSDGPAPTNRHADCIDGKRVLGTCIAAGCYTPSQRILFARHYMSLPQALETNLEHVTALDDDWLTDGVLRFVDEEIESYVKGIENGKILVIEADDGSVLEVTPNHPLVNNLGQIIEAQTLQVGQTRLLTLDGEALVVKVEEIDYNGEVWNIQPKSQRTLGNVLVAEGFLTGSIRYQNEWAHDESRLELRRKLDATSF